MVPVPRKSPPYRCESIRLEGEPGAVRVVRIPGAVHDDDLARTQLVAQDPLGQRVLDLALDGPAQRSGAHGRLTILRDDEPARVIGQDQTHVALPELVGYPRR